MENGKRRAIAQVRLCAAAPGNQTVVMAPVQSRSALSLSNARFFSIYMKEKLNGDVQIFPFDYSKNPKLIVSHQFIESACNSRSYMYSIYIRN